MESPLSPEVGGDTEAINWVESVTNRLVERSEPLLGGMSSLVQRCWLSDGSSVVVRHITDRDWLAREPGLIDRESTAMELLAEARLSGHRLTAPTHLASEPEAGLLLMSWLPGQVQTDGKFLAEHVSSIANAAAVIAAVPLSLTATLSSATGGDRLGAWQSWVSESPEPPAWGDKKLWLRAIEIYTNQPVPTNNRAVLLHRDLHPLNVLWSGGELTGVVDWVNACIGHPHAELGHCRWNLAVLAGQEAADEFLDCYLGAVDLDGESYDPWWDLASVLGLLPGPLGVSGWHAVGRTDLTLGKVVQTTEAFLSTAVSAALQR